MKVKSLSCVRCSVTPWTASTDIYKCNSYQNTLGIVHITKIMASGPITSWQIDGETVETVSDFIFMGSKITADGDCSHEIKRHSLLGRIIMTNLHSILKSRDITLPTSSV